MFPCGADKRPLVRWKNEATRDPTTLAGWWRQWPDAMVGLPMGKASGLFALDVDVDKATGELTGEASLAELGLGELLTAPNVVATPSGGRHVYFRHPEGDGLGNSAKRLGAGLDTRGEGGFVIAPGSVNEAGAYIAAEGFDLDTLPALPDALREALTRLRTRNGKGAAAERCGSEGASSTAAPSRWAAAALAAELGRVAAAAEGTRNDALNAAAFALGQIVGGGALAEADVADRLLGAARAAGLPEAEARTTIASGLAAGMAEPRGPADAPNAGGAGDGTPDGLPEGFQVRPGGIYRKAEAEAEEDDGQTE